MTKIVLIDAQGYWLKRNREEVDQVVLPLGLMYLAASARQKMPNQLDFKIYNSVVDFDNDPLRIGDALAKDGPHLVGIRGMTRYSKEFKEIVAIVRARTQALVVGGGPYISSDESAALQTGIDIAIVDEGEQTFAELIDCFRSGRKLQGIQGTAYLEGGKVVREPKRPFLNDSELDQQAFPAYDLIDMDAYSRQLSYGYNKRRQGVIYSSRGCPYRCDFCHVLFGKNFRQRSPESLFREFLYLYENWDVKDFYIVDDIFNLQKNRAIDFFKMLIASKMHKNIRIYFVNGLRGDRVDEEFIDYAVEAGTVWLAYALETASPRLQKHIQKSLNIEKVKKAIEYSHKKGVAVIYWAMLGIDSETIEEAQATVDMLNSLPPSTIPMLFSLKPYPGTGAYQKFLAKQKNLEEEIVFHFEDNGGSYHSFLGLLARDERYQTVIKSWTDHVQSPSYMENAMSRLFKIGHSEEEVRAAYGLLYRRLSKEKIDGLVELCLKRSSH